MTFYIEGPCLGKGVHNFFKCSFLEIAMLYVSVIYFQP